MAQDNRQQDKREKGIAVLTKLFGAGPGGGSMPENFAAYTVEHLFGEVWADDTLPLEQRSMLTCAVLVALGRENEQRIHFRGAKNLGIEKAQVEAIISHVAHYAGWPVSVSAFRVLNDVWDA